MNTLPLFTLAEAISYIEFQKGRKILAIQYEDGSGRKFNVQFFGSNKWQFVQL
jgi:hypothetical protein